jgi:hypothetical protein
MFWSEKIIYNHFVVTHNFILVQGIFNYIQKICVILK